ncbi:3-oxo-tetronate kinase [Tropicimonas sediminicola]|uniref:3-oxo-tetronate kinase n=1 Tax=Tropicimonas sediminicola TaxID=1031541 RepID=A0A239LKP1_9RHOB|nr:3-oxo-tetronate kinase [Tropicimonas sediminicola]SNT31237.1 Uncharacterized conserved protein YgbK, DUF1537 family [Tropicimonas sediminicola]
MKIGVVADDFTGASDIGLTLAEGGFRVSQFIGVPDVPAEAALDAGVIALKSRTAPVAEAVAQSVAACDWLLAQGAQQIVLKVCSTFDSTPHGNIGPVLEALAERIGEDQVLVCPAFPENGRSVYQGHLFVADRLLSESGMQNHPLTPMTDPDLRRVLAAQTGWDIAHVPALSVWQGAAAIQAAIPEARAMVIVDAVRDEDLRVIGQAARNRRLLCGGSGIAIGLPSNFGARPAAPSWEPVDGPGIVLSGSCSIATRGQVETYAAQAPSLQIEAEAAVAGEVDIDALADWAVAQTTPPLLFSSADPDEVRAAQRALGQERVAEAIEAVFARLAQALVARGTSRIVVAGGETSGAVVAALGPQVLEIGPRIAPGVPLMRLPGQPARALALKSGNFGGPDFFSRALDLMAASS